MGIDTLRKYAYLSIIAIASGVAIYLFFRFVFVLTLPFLIAWAVAYMTEKPSIAIHKATRLPHRLIRPVLTLVITASLLSLVIFGAYRLAYELWQLISSGAKGEIVAKIGELAGGGILGNIFGELTDSVEGILSSLFSSLMEGIGGFLSGFVSAVPKAILFIVVTLISAIYFSLDLDLIGNYIRGALPSRAVSFLSRLKRGVFDVGVRYVTSYGLLMLITFLTVLTGLAIMRVPHAAVLSLVISALDVLPVIGVGTALIPWSAVSLIEGNTPFGIGLIVLWAVHTVIRQFAEPKILGRNLGVHPILTLIFLYVGYALFGLGGILLVPVFTILLNVAFGKNNAADVKRSKVG